MARSRQRRFSGMVEEPTMQGKFEAGFQILILKE